MISSEGRCFLPFSRVQNDNEALCLPEESGQDFGLVIT